MHLHQEPAWRGFLSLRDPPALRDGRATSAVGHAMRLNAGCVEHQRRAAGRCDCRGRVLTTMPALNMLLKRKNLLDEVIDLGVLVRASIDDSSDSALG